MSFRICTWGEKVRMHMWYFSVVTGIPYHLESFPCMSLAVVLSSDKTDPLVIKFVFVLLVDIFIYSYLLLAGSEMQFSHPCQIHFKGIAGVFAF